MLNYKLTRFNNGLKVITAPLKNTRAVSIFILIGTGSRYEKASQNGLAHFVEHMLFKGTKKRPKTIEIARELDAIGASYNAFTGEEYTGLYVRAESSHFDLGLDILNDILKNSLFEPAEIEKEKGVIIEEINMIKDIPQAYVEYVMKELLWGNQPLGRMITGSKETVPKFQKSDFISFLKNHYQPEDMIIAVAGQNCQDWLPKVKNVFGQAVNQQTKSFQKIKESQDSPKLKIFNKQTDQINFILGFRGIKRTDKRRPILKVLNNIMGDTMSSRLFTEIRERRGLCYYISSDIADYIDTGFWGVSAGVDINKIDVAIKLILDEFNKMKKTTVTDEELNRSKENLKGHLYLGLEESMAVAQFLAEQEMFWQKIDDPDKVANDYQKVTKEEVKTLAKDIFKKENLNLALVGSCHNEEKFKKILKEFQ